MPGGAARSDVAVVRASPLRPRPKRAEWLTQSSALSESTRTPPRGSGRGSRLEQSYLVSSR